MKKKSLFVITAILTLAAVIAVAVGCNRIVDPEAIDLVKNYYAETVNATKITQSVTIKNSDTLVSSDVTVYNVAADKSVSGTKTVKTLNDDINASKLYTETVTPVSISAENAAKSLPTSVTLNADDYVDGTEIYTDTSYSFSIKQTSIQAFFGITADEAEDIKNVNITIFFSDKKVTEYRATYTTDNGNTAEIKITFEYAA